MAKHSIQITDSKLYENIAEYCKENGLKISFLCTDMLRKQFLIEKFGDIPFGNFQDHEVTYDDKIVTSDVINTNNPSTPSVITEETIDKVRCKTNMPSVITVPLASEDLLTNEEKETIDVPKNEVVQTSIDIVKKPKKRRL